MYEIVIKIVGTIIFVPMWFVGINELFTQYL